MRVPDGTFFFIFLKLRTKNVFFSEMKRSPIFSRFTKNYLKFPIEVSENSNF